MSNQQSNWCDGQVFKWLLASGVAWLEQHKQHVNAMNVFPVPDGDTGTNMLFTLQQAYQAIANSDETHLGKVCERMANASRWWSQGNSGTILSMLLHGFAQALSSVPAMDSKALAQACDGAVHYAYTTVQSVMPPVEGTILSVARAVRDSVVLLAEQEADLRRLLAHMVEASRVALALTPEQLPILKETGVVDSGGMGLVVILEGMLRLVSGETLAPLPEQTVAPVQTWEAALQPQDEQGYGYDVQFVMLGESLDVSAIRQAISAMGWSPLVDGDSRLVKVHVHVHNPAEPIGYAIGLGVQLDNVIVENMQAQYLRYVQDRQTREQDPPKHGVGVIAVANGSGLERLFREYGASSVIVGGQTMNPSTEDFVRAINALPHQEIIILPNNSNVILTANQAKHLTDKRVIVLPTKTIPQGVSTLIAIGNLTTISSSPLELMAERLIQHMGGVLTLEITIASRDIYFQGVSVKEWAFIGLVNDVLKASDEIIERVMHRLLAELSLEAYSLATLYWGAKATLEQVQSLAGLIRYYAPHLEIELYYGGQPLYPFIIGIE